MSNQADSAAALIARIERKAPEYHDLLTAETVAEFESAFDALMQKAVARLETNKSNLATLDEVGLSAFLAAALSVPGLSVVQEAHSNGHVDLTIDADHCVPARRKLGEAKIYRGPEYHIQGLVQLLGPYTTGREARGLLVVYVRKKNIASLVKKLRDALDDEHPCKQQGDTAPYALKWSFLSRHSLSSGDLHEVSHIGCNLYAE